MRAADMTFKFQAWDGALDGDPRPAESVDADKKSIAYCKVWIG